MTYIARTFDVRHDGLETPARCTTTSDGAQHYEGEGVDNLPDGRIRIKGPSVVAGDRPGTFRVQN